MVVAPTRQQQEQLQHLKRELAAAQVRWTESKPAVAAAQAEWELTLRKNRQSTDWSFCNGLEAHFPLDGDATDHAGTRKDGKPPVGHFQDGIPSFGPGKLQQASQFDGRRYLDAGNACDFGFYDKFSLAAWVYPEGTGDGTILSRMIDVDQGEGYSLRLKNGQVQLNLVKRWLDDALRVETFARLTPGQWHHVLATYDGSRTAQGVRLYVNGTSMPIHIDLDELNQSFQTMQPLRIGAGGGKDGRFHGLLNEVQVFRDVLTAEEAKICATADSIPAIAGLPPAKRSSGQAGKIRRCFLETSAPAVLRQAWRRAEDLRRQTEQFLESLPTTMIMEDMPTPRPTHVLIRGQYDKPGAAVQPGVPACLPSLPTGSPLNRLTLARWLVDPGNPLTARVAVNRFWQMYFGAGLVKTVEDFGSQGEWPTHPDLLEWLVTEFIRSGWDVKRFQRTIVTSSTYRQTSRVTPALWQKDPENRLLARGPRSRLSAEMVRDQALAASGLFVERIGGSSVKPYQPAGLWKELGDVEYEQDKGHNLYRRSLYTFWKRTVPPPTMVSFDAAGREACTVRETRTNTPLQALSLLNEVTFVEAARVLAQRVLEDGPDTPEGRITLAFQLATGRKPRPVELQILLSNLQTNLDRYRHDSQAALELVSAGEAARNHRIDSALLASYTAVTELILNLDETVTKE
jgi:hypothetical protein